MRIALMNGGRLALGAAASIGLGWLAIRGLDWGQVRESLGAMSPWLLALALVVFMGASYLRAYRWRVLFVDVDIPTVRLFVIQNEGIGMNNLVPVRIASEATQLAVLTVRDRIDGATALATLAMERVADVVASTLILAIAFFLVPEMKSFTIYVWGSVGFSLVVLALVRFFAWGSNALAFVKRIPFLASFAAAVRDLERARWRLVGVLLLSAVYWLTIGIVTWLVAQAVGLGISPVTATLVIVGTIFFATAIPALQASVGTFEAAVVFVLGYFGTERSEGLAFAVMIHALLFIPPTVMAVVLLPREGVVSLRQVRRLIGGGVGFAGGSGG